MCFSPEASFAGGVIISTIGIATVKKIHSPSQITFASIPLVFGLQQITEGFLWLTLPFPEYAKVQILSTYSFLIIAQVLWPIMIPLSVLLMEENNKKRTTLKLLLVLGLFLSLYYSFCLLFYKVDPQLLDYHIQYKTTFPKSLRIVSFIAYLFATITPLFVSSIKKTHLMGLLMFLSCLVTAIFFRQYLTSVWCFFAAVISGIIYWIMKDLQKNSTAKLLK